MIYQCQKKYRDDKGLKLFNKKSSLQIGICRLVCCPKYSTFPRREQSAFMSVPTIQTVKGRVVFFRKGREKISTLNPLTAWIFAAAISPPKTGNRIFPILPRRFRPLHFTAKPSALLRRLSLGFAGLRAPRPRPLPKNRMLRNRGQKGLIFKAFQTRKFTE